MPNIRNVIVAEIDPGKPLHEICGVIDSVVRYQPEQEEAILRGLHDVIAARLKDMKKGAEEDGKQVRKPNAEQADQG